MTTIKNLSISEINVTLSSYTHLIHTTCCFKFVIFLSYAYMEMEEIKNFIHLIHTVCGHQDVDRDIKGPWGA